MDLLSDYDYHLPEQLIAQTPLPDRGASRLLHLNRVTGGISDRMFADVPDLLCEGDLLVLNETRVTALRLFGQKPTGAAVEALLIAKTGERRYSAMVKPGKRLRLGATIEFADGLVAQVIRELDEPLKELEFESVPDLEDRLSHLGSVPLPPYIRAQLEDPERYQTVYGTTGGSAAAPTAGLHFKPELLQRLKSQGVDLATVTLDVGLDTFRPVTASRLDEHQMHGETCRVPESTVRAIAAAKGRIIAVGTTSARTLEAFAHGPRRLDWGERKTNIFIRPGYRWQIVDGMFTNFHMPRTTMLMMISALASRESIMNAYSHAVANHYRFLSFGDSMLIL